MQSLQMRWPVPGHIGLSMHDERERADRVALAAQRVHLRDLLVERAAGQRRRRAGSSGTSPVFASREALRAGVLLALVAEQAVVRLAEHLAARHARVRQREALAAAAARVRSDPLLGQVRHWADRSRRDGGSRESPAGGRRPSRGSRARRSARVMRARHQRAYVSRRDSRKARRSASAGAGGARQSRRLRPRRPARQLRRARARRRIDFGHLLLAERGEKRALEIQELGHGPRGRELGVLVPLEIREELPLDRARRRAQRARAAASSGSAALTARRWRKSRRNRKRTASGAAARGLRLRGRLDAEEARDEAGEVARRLDEQARSGQGIERRRGLPVRRQARREIRVLAREPLAKDAVEIREPLVAMEVLVGEPGNPREGSPSGCRLGLALLPSRRRPSTCGPMIPRRPRERMAEGA